MEGESIESIESVARKCFDWGDKSIVNSLVFFCLVFCIASQIYGIYSNVKNRKNSNPMNIVMNILCLLLCSYFIYILACDATKAGSVRNFVTGSTLFIILGCIIIMGGGALFFYYAVEEERKKIESKKK